MEPDQTPGEIAPIPPYTYPAPLVEPEQPKERSKPVQVPPYQRPPTRPGASVPEPVARVPPKGAQAAEHPIVTMSHPETVTLPPVQEVERYQKPIETLTSKPEKELTPVKEKPFTKAPEKMNGNLTNQPQNVNFPVKKSDNFSPAPTAKKLPKKMQFKGKKGRQRTEAEVRDLLTFVQNRNGAWPNDNYVSEQMRRYYRREYPEYFRKARKGKKVQSAGSPPINISTRRTGTGV